jgi:hypothetical protein
MNQDQVREVFDLARTLLADADGEGGEAVGFVSDFNEALVEFEKQAWNRGVEFGARVVHRSWEQSARRSLAEAFGKDLADGELDFGFAGRGYANGDDKFLADEVES